MRAVVRWVSDFKRFDRLAATRIFALTLNVFGLIIFTSGLITPTAFASIRAPIHSWSDTCNVPGEYSSGAEVCVARDSWINWSGPDLVFDASYANQPSSDGACVSHRLSGRTDILGWPFNGYYCPDGYQPRNYTYVKSCAPKAHFKGDAAYCERTGLEPLKTSENVLANHVVSEIRFMRIRATSFKLKAILLPEAVLLSSGSIIQKSNTTIASCTHH